MFDVTDLLDHAQAKYVARLFELDADFVAGSGFLAPHDVADQVIVALENGYADLHPLQYFQRPGRYESETTQADIGDGLIGRFLVLVILPAGGYLYRHVHRVANVLSYRRIIGQELPTFY